MILFALLNCMQIMSEACPATSACAQNPVSRQACSQSVERIHNAWGLGGGPGHPFLKTSGEKRDDRVANALLKPFGFERINPNVNIAEAAFNAKIVRGIAAYLKDLNAQIEKEDDKETKKAMNARL